jgi:hypothetical protein
MKMIGYAGEKAERTRLDSTLPSGDSTLVSIFVYILPSSRR